MRRPVAPPYGLVQATVEDRVEQRAGLEEFDVVVIGGGQAGLAIGYELAGRGLSFVILDGSDRIGDSWRRRWDSLRLFTPARYDSLPGMPFPGPSGSYPTKDEAADYLEAYAERYDLPVRTRTRVDGVFREEGRFVVTAGDRRFHADSVVVANGASHTPRIPDFASDFGRAVHQLHSSEYREPSQLREGDVLVVGAGNSGAEIALELSGRHRVWLSGRDPGQEPTRAGSLPDRLFTPVMWFMASRVVDVRTPIGRKVRDRFLDPPRGIPLGRVRRKDLAAAGIERVPRTEGARDGRPVLEDGQVLDVANVVWCTGFRFDFSWIDLPVFGRTGLPIHTRGVVDAQPGLCFMGLPFLSTLSSGLIGGAGKDARRIAGHLASMRTVPTGVAAPPGRARLPAS
jgi:putative flavoprotein involved in K+ transport